MLIATEWQGTERQRSIWFWPFRCLRGSSWKTECASSYDSAVWARGGGPGSCRPRTCSLVGEIMVHDNVSNQQSTSARAELACKPVQSRLATLTRLWTPACHTNASPVDHLAGGGVEAVSDGDAAAAGAGGVHHGAHAAGQHLRAGNWVSLRSARVYGQPAPVMAHPHPDNPCCKVLHNAQSENDTIGTVYVSADIAAAVWCKQCPPCPAPRPTGRTS